MLLHVLYVCTTIFEKLPLQIAQKWAAVTKGNLVHHFYESLVFYHQRMKTVYTNMGRKCFLSHGFQSAMAGEHIAWNSAKWNYSYETCSALIKCVK